MVWHVCRLSASGVAPPHVLFLYVLVLGVWWEMCTVAIPTFCLKTPPALSYVPAFGMSDHEYDESMLGSYVLWLLNDVVWVKPCH